MSTQAHKAAAWIYRGIWGVLVGLFRVPHEPPTLPVASGNRHDSFQPGDGYLRYLKFKFWVVLVLMDIFFTAIWIAATVALLAAELPIWAALIAIPALAIIVLPDIVAYIAIHLRYDTMWYVLTDRSMRIRRGLWVIHEITITFENVQNVTVQQGPLERWFGIASVVVETAGGASGPHQQQSGMSHQGVLEGIGNAQEVRDLILSRVRASTSAGLGDERSHARAALGVHADAPPSTGRGAGWTAEHVAALRAIRDEIRGLRRSGAAARS